MQLARQSRQGHVAAEPDLEIGRLVAAAAAETRVEPQAEDLPGLGLMERLVERRAITLAEYEMLHEGRKEKSVLEPRREFVLAGIDSQGYRHYEFVE